MKLENQSYNKLFQTGNKELVYIVNKAIEEDDIKTINKVISTIKEFRKQTELTKQFGNEILSDIANTIKGTDFFDDNLSLLDNYRLLDNQKDILLRAELYDYLENTLEPHLKRSVSQSRKQECKSEQTVSAQEVSEQARENKEKNDIYGQEELELFQEVMEGIYGEEI